MTGQALSFDVARHEYRHPDGHLVPSVTRILRETGVSTDFDGLAASSPRLAEAINYKRDLGQAVHADAHAYDDHDLDWTTVDPRVKPYLQAWSIFRENFALSPLTRERRLYSAELGVCGTLDGVFVRDTKLRDRRILIDIKLGDPDAAGARYQTAGYELLWLAERPEEPIAERWSVQLTPEHRIPYRVTNYTAEERSWEHFAAFRAFVTTYFCQAARRAA